jgi:hypothetical protein
VAREDDNEGGNHPERDYRPIGDVHSHLRLALTIAVAALELARSLALAVLLRVVIA